MNQLVISGYVGRDPEQAQYKDNTVWRFTVGVGNRAGKTEWFNVSVFTRTEKHSGYISGIKKGMPVTVSGPVSLNQYEKNGVKYSSLQLVANEVFYSAKAVGAVPSGSDVHPSQQALPAQAGSEPEEGYDPFES